MTQLPLFVVNVLKIPKNSNQKHLGLKYNSLRNALWRKKGRLANLSCALSFSRLASVSTFVFFSASSAFSKSRNLNYNKPTDSWMYLVFITAQDSTVFLDDCVLGQFLSWTLTRGERRVRLRSTLPTFSLDWDCPTNNKPNGCHILLQVPTSKVFLPEVRRVCGRAVLSPTRFLWSVDEHHPTTASSQLSTKRNVWNWNQNEVKIQTLLMVTLQVLSLHLKLSIMAAERK